MTTLVPLPGDAEISELGIDDILCADAEAARPSTATAARRMDLSFIVDCEVWWSWFGGVDCVDYAMEMRRRRTSPSAPVARASSAAEEGSGTAVTM